MSFAQLFIGTANAQGAAPSAAASTASYGMNFLPLILIGIVFYVLLIRPQQKKLDELSKLVKNLSRGDRIITAGGIHGKIVKLLDDGEHIMVEIADGVHVKVVRSTVTGLAAKTEPLAQKSIPSADTKSDKKA